MAIIFMEGFEDNSLDRFFLVSGASAYSSSGLNMSGSYVMECSGTGDYARVALQTSYTELWVTYRFRTTGATGNSAVIFYDSEGTAIFSVRVYNNKMNICWAALGSNIVAGTKTISNNTTYLVKVHFIPLNSNGSMEVYVDDMVTPDVTTSARDTTAGLENIAAVQFGYSGNSYCYFDDIVISTTDITNNLRVANLAITGAGTTTQWDPSAGSNYENVDDTTADDTNYNSTNTTDEIDTFALADNSTAAVSIVAVGVNLRCNFSGSPTPKHLQAVLRTHSTNYASGTDLHPPLSFQSINHQQIWETNPNTGVAWTDDELDALEVGYKATT